MWRKGMARARNRIRIRDVGIATLAALWFSPGLISAAAAQSYPSRPVRLIVPFAAGGPLDLVARSLTDRLAATLGQPFVVENRVGAGGNIGTEAAAKAEPDGYTLLFVLSGTLVANPAVFKKLPFDPGKDFIPISLVTATRQMLVVHPSVPVNTVAEFVQYAKSNPVTYAHAGPGSGGHLAMGYFSLLAGFSGTPVPYRGNAPLMTDLAAGQVQSGFIASAGAIPHVQAGRLKGLAIAGETRSPLVPSVPTMSEAGYPKLKLDTYFVLLAPANTPLNIVRLLEREVQAITKLRDVTDKWRTSDIDPLGTSAAEAAAVLKEERALWGDVVRRAKLDQH
ncbi:MAG: tripartite tricarboxylate transporter substrate binding protein [Rhizobiales bacterium]|nr:tripartite tricarboxylate transporter substrate binding protein [Hyphomicrobiales bacterium]